MNRSGKTEVISYAGEVKRKAVHLVALTIPIGYFLAPKSWAVGLLLLAWGIALLIDVLRLLHLPAYRWIRPLVNPVIRPQEDHDFTGATYILFAGLFCRLAFDVPAAAAAMGFIILGDTAAALIGRRWGRHRYGHKSYEGSLAFLLCAVFWAIIIPGISLGWGLTAAVLATLVEATSGLIDDNVSVPLVAGAFLHYVPLWIY